MGSAGKEPSNAPVFSVVGWAVFAALAPSSLRLAYEQTLLTWSEGPQMVGFTMAHVFPLLLLLGIAGFLGYSTWLLVLYVKLIRNWRKKQTPLPRAILMQGLAIGTAVVVQAIPYGTWMTATVIVAGPGQHGPAFLSYAADDGDTSLVNLLLNRGAPVNAANGNGATALNGACVTHSIDIARSLIARGADPNMTKDCWEIPEFRAKMKPIVPGADPYAKFPRLADTTIYVNGNGTSTSETAAPQTTQ